MAKGNRKRGHRRRAVLYGMLCIQYQGAHCNRTTAHLPKVIPDGTKKSILAETEGLEMISDALDLGWEPIYAEDADGEVMWFKKTINLRGR